MSRCRVIKGLRFESHEEDEGIMALSLFNRNADLDQARWIHVRVAAVLRQSFRAGLTAAFPASRPE